MSRPERVEDNAPEVNADLRERRLPARAAGASTHAFRQLRRGAPSRRISSGSPRSARVDLPDPGRTARGLAQAIVEVLAGARPPVQLTDLVTIDVLRMLRRGTGRLGSLPGRPAPRPVIASVRVCEPCEAVAEVSAVIATGVRMRALALRLEGIDGRWRCTAVHLG
ncbi:MAG TPA: Rv3235 family protein [Mycobacteriales bacterium]|nr:Rv3235 family protein [Mycobacteriales bacterium]